MTISKKKTTSTDKPPKVDIWAVVGSINTNNELPWDEIEGLYEPYIINKALSYFPDTVLYADEMNRFHEIPKKAQYGYLLNSIRPKKRFSKWAKKEKEDSSFLAVQEYFQYNNKKTEEALKILTPEQINMIKKELETGG